MVVLQVIVCVTFIWSCIPVCIYIMKKLRPESYKLYAIYSITVALAFTLFAISRLPF
ncbi:hypothetical protein NUITMVRE32_18110 [Enterococcus faecium]|nr:hypothetical protein EfmAA610_19440 [Enterococcus faecium]BDP90758.1 hypothetical protein EfmGK923_09310 [Enterococcus faecium]BDP93948.1 hypothetical protein EfmGK941_09530 [Enterococcus faecium]GIP72837.1 hypothetical protein EFM1_16260 [Enterococcus faecium]GJG90879.1 hypothetical protein EFL1_10190 [Enterococcus faecium]